MIDAALVSLITSGVTTRLVSQAGGWVVRQVKSPRQPDLVVTSPNGDETYVVELKVGDDRPRFAEVAQVENSADLVSSQVGSAKVHPILVTDSSITDSVDAAARAAGVKILSVEGSADEIAQEVVERILGDSAERQSATEDRAESPRQ